MDNVIARWRLNSGARRGGWLPSPPSGVNMGLTAMPSLLSKV